MEHGVTSGRRLVTPDPVTAIPGMGACFRRAAAGASTAAPSVPYATVAIQQISRRSSCHRSGFSGAF
jgi:hypothetical protein